MRELVDKRLMLEDVKSWVAMDSYEQHLINNMSEWIENLPTVEVSDGDCISRQAALDALRSCQTYLFDAKDPDKKIELRSAELVIEGLPPVQPERKKGEWLRYGEDGYPNNEDTVFWQCDQCLEQYTGRTKRIPNFCPNCGADMRKGK